MSVHRSVQDLEICCIISWSWRHNWKAVVGCPLNAHRQVWCVSTPLHHRCLLNFVPCVCIDPTLSNQDLEIYRIISRQVHISEAEGILGRALVGLLSTAHLQIWSLSAPLHHLCMLNFVPCMCIDPFKIYSLISRLESKPYTRGILGRDVAGSPSNAHPQVWCLSAPLHYLCLLKFVSCVCIIPFKI